MLAYIGWIVAAFLGGFLLSLFLWQRKPPIPCGTISQGWSFSRGGVIERF